MIPRECDHRETHCRRPAAGLQADQGVKLIEGSGSAGTKDDHRREIRTPVLIHVAGGNRFQLGPERKGEQAFGERHGTGLSPLGPIGRVAGVLDRKVHRLGCLPMRRAAADHEESGSGGRGFDDRLFMKVIAKEQRTMAD